PSLIASSNNQPPPPPPPSSSLIVDNQISTELPSTVSLPLDNHSIEDVTFSLTNQCVSNNSNQTLM
ncbi:unnamed protein product, partial [Adineta steineri]